MAFLDRLSSTEKRRLAWGLGGASVIVLGVSLLGRKKPKPKKADYGIRVNALCSEWTVTDPTRLQLARQEIFSRFVQRGISDPWTITSAFVAKIAGHCRRPSPTRPANEMRNPGEAIFYYAAFTDILCALLDAKLFTAEEAIAKAKMAQGWAIEQGVEPNDPVLMDPACAVEQLGGGGGGQGGQGPAWLTCDPPTVALKVQGTWECRCPDGRAPQLVEQGGMMVPVC